MKKYKVSEFFSEPRYFTDPDKESFLSGYGRCISSRIYDWQSFDGNSGFLIEKPYSSQVTPALVIFYLGYVDV